MAERLAADAGLVAEDELAVRAALAGRVDAAHTLLYGHRVWPQVKRTILKTALETSWPDLPALVTRHNRLSQRLLERAGLA